MRETGGRTFSPEKNTTISNAPTTKLGKALAATAVIEMTWSAGRPARKAATVPKTRDNGIIRRVVAPANIAELNMSPLTNPQMESRSP